LFGVGSSQGHVFVMSRGLNKNMRCLGLDSARLHFVSLLKMILSVEWIMLRRKIDRYTRK